jgi:hypothetical protein
MSKTVQAEVPNDLRSSPGLWFQLRTPFNFVLLNLVLNELLISSVGLPFDFTAAFYQVTFRQRPGLPDDIF